MKRRTVGLGLLGTTLDAGLGVRRWERWRPTVSLFQHEDLLVDRYELLVPPGNEALVGTVVDDIREVSPETEVRVHRFEMPDPWDFARVYAGLLDFVRGYRFDTDREDYLVHITTGSHVAQICLFLLTESRHLPAKLVQTSPPRKKDDESPGSYAIIDLDLSTYDLLARRFAEEKTEGLSFLKQGIETKNAAFNRMIERLEEIALASPEPILLTGPTGAGKSQLAKRIYDLKRGQHRVKGDFVEVNCATIRGDQAMSTLFGHVKGAFTGALAPRAGLLRRADSGMLFLDEIGELGLDEQAMLLRAIETGTFLPVGSDREVTSQFLLLCGTNRDLRARVREGLFREDLLARIDLWTFRLPALRERLEDLEPNLEYETRRVGRRLGKNLGWSKEARARYVAFATSPAAAWTGNFRDLAASVTRLGTLAHGGRIDVQAVEEELARLRASWSSEPGPGGAGGYPRIAKALGPDAALDRFDAAQLEDVLSVVTSAESLSAAGRALFAESRRRKSSVNDADRLRKYLARFGLSFGEIPG
ncbi:MAG: RNA repair transcriptional activator RtcR [Polyangiales bacterium]